MLLIDLMDWLIYKMDSLLVEKKQRRFWTGSTDV